MWYLLQSVDHEAWTKSVSFVIKSVLLDCYLKGTGCFLWLVANNLYCHGTRKAHFQRHVRTPAPDIYSNEIKLSEKNKKTKTKGDWKERKRKYLYGKTKAINDRWRTIKYLNVRFQHSVHQISEGKNGNAALKCILI